MKASSDALGHLTFQHHPTPSPPTPTPPCPDRGVFCFVIRALEQLPDNTAILFEANMHIVGKNYLWCSESVKLNIESSSHRGLCL